MSQIQILIVDDNFVARRGLRSFLQTERDIKVVGEASTGKAAVEWINKNHLTSNDLITIKAIFVRRIIAKQPAIR